MSLPFPGHDRAKHMGELKRGEQRWNVFLEIQPDAELTAVRGRLHFVGGPRGGGSDSHRSTSWIFLEASEREIRERFDDFSAVELWHFVAALEGDAGRGP